MFPECPNTNCFATASSPLPDINSSLRQTTDPLNLDSTLQLQNRSASSTLIMPDETLQLTISPSLGDSMGSAFNLGTLITRDMVDNTYLRKTTSNTLSSSDAADYYRFTIDRPASVTVQLSKLVNEGADLLLIRDANNNGKLDQGEMIDASYLLGNQSELIHLKGLGADTYFVEVRNTSRGTSNYNLSIDVTAGAQHESYTNRDSNTPATATPINGLQLNGTRVVQGNVNSSTDPNDYYRFELYHPTDFNAFLFPGQSNANLYLYYDANKNSRIEASELLGYSATNGTTTDFIDKNRLEPGIYYLQVQKPVSSGATDYTLRIEGAPLNLLKTAIFSSALSTTSIAPAVAVNSPITVDYDFGNINGGFFIQEDSLSNSDRNDFYRFNVNATSNISAVLRNMSGPMDLEIIRDANNNGQVDPGEVMVTGTPTNGNKIASITGLAPGSYLVGISSNSSLLTANYTLELNATGKSQEVERNDMFSQAMSLGNLRGSRNIQGSVNANNDPNDFYQFDITAPSQLRLTMANLTADANISLISDFNNNGIIDAGDRFATSALTGNASETINRDRLEPGRYFLQVNKVSDASVATGYDLSLFSAPITRAQITVNLDEILALDKFDASVPFTNWDQADFYGTVKIGGIERSLGGVFSDQNLIRNLPPIIQAVDPNSQWVRIVIDLKDEDGIFDDAVDINSSQGDNSLLLTYDTLTGRITRGIRDLGSEGQRIIQAGGDGDAKNAQLTFRVSYETFL